MAAPPQSPICVDASVVATMLLPESTTDRAIEQWQAWVDAERPLIAPPHFAPEVVSAARRAVLQGRITLAEEDAALQAFLDRLLPKVTVRQVGQFVWERAVARARDLNRAGVYDTLYLAVAEDAGAEFWTTDGNLTRALEADGDPLPAWVHLVEP